MKKYVFITMVAFTLFAPKQADAILIDFEGIAPVNGYTIVTNSNLVFNGFNVFVDYSVYIDPLFDNTNRSYNGTDYLANNTANGLTLTQVSGEAFSIQSFQAGEYFTSFSGNHEINVVGQLSGGGVLNANFATDANPSDGIGGIEDFETFLFGSEWMNLTSVHIGSLRGKLSLDNILVEDLPNNANAVPEPATMLLFTTGLVGAYFRRRHV